ncbi:hypothetical protein ERICIV_04535 (plasmid) [Paenibacillus larvae subsp. larvae]|uniref:Uncharacterized protein n=1 Tax=Paenibacillus larvae subsp. larvae TaxID=147375 RepID=A0A2L1U7K7_9BACL|nr:hypothetical protein [Paenibacillus larvae]AQT86994.1 hypothetical protein B1222_23465 [Paenibacillus larvae subsp. pulvifaciens]AQZ49327.1 hypothetical protein B5S25_22770 [Paenibacillus larvae subsp. pulvifaciens]AVF28917.1 hypothetical protein ERICIII_04915 [Paenibacillus larvae subsp. larvae]AVF33299.1 hypothetical protein ERICIV_04535 [Paenibacillus larvae subsp. larvae]MBH0344825.1 hypothetical protein [Paenibacillus larvae]
MARKYLFKKDGNSVDIDWAKMRSLEKRKKMKRWGSLVGLVALISTTVFANYYLTDRTYVEYVDDNHVSVNGKIVAAEKNDQGRLVPKTGLTDEQLKETNYLPDQKLGENNGKGDIQTGNTVPIFIDGKFTGEFGNVWDDDNYGGYTQTKEGWVQDKYGKKVKYEWNGDSVNVVTGKNSGGNNGDSSTPGTPGRNDGNGGGDGNNNGGDNGGVVPPIDPPPPPPRYEIDSIELYHNNAWEDARKRNNRSTAEFYAGEPVLVKVRGENIASAKVTFNFGNPNQDMPKFMVDGSDRRPSFNQTVTLTGSGSSSNGQGWQKHWAMIPDGKYRATITVKYTNGKTESRTRDIVIRNSAIDNMQPGGF